MLRDSTCFHSILVLATFIQLASAETPVGPPFTYQGRLTNSSSPANGPHNFEFRLFDDAVSSSGPIGGPLVLNAIDVTDGLFTVQLNGAGEFGPSAFNGARRWLEVKVNGQLLSPRQELTAAPYAHSLRPGARINTPTAQAIVADTASATGMWGYGSVFGMYGQGTIGVGGTGTNSGVNGFCATADGVLGVTTTGKGVRGTANDPAGFAGYFEGRGYFSEKVGIGTASPTFRLDVFGDIHGEDSTGLGAVQGFTESGIGLYGSAELFIGGCATGIGVKGSSECGAGVRGESSFGIGMHGLSTASYGVKGESTSNDGIHGLAHTSVKSGVWGFNDGGGTGVTGSSLTGVGVGATSGGTGLNAPALRVENTSATGIATWSVNNSSDANLVVSNSGTGPLIRCFSNANGGAVPVFDVRNDGRTVVTVLEITGADLAEKFPTTDEKVEAGTVMEIDPDHPGRLRISREAYNARVAGVVSGAGDIPVGAILGNLPGHENAPAIALSGRVWVKCDGAQHAIRIGDPLTTADVPGRAMRAADANRARGAIIGKAMTPLAKGESGLVLVLVNMQ